MHEVIDRIVAIDAAACSQIDEAAKYSAELTDSVSGKIAEMKAAYAEQTQLLLTRHREQKNEELRQRCQEIERDTQEKAERMVALCRERRADWVQQIYLHIVGISKEA